MADDDAGLETLDRADFDEQEDRVGSMAALFGPAPNTYQVILATSRDHAAAAPVDANASGWLPLGPRNVGGAVRCLAQHPTTPNEWLAGSAQAGVWKSINDGYGWRPVGGPKLFGSVCSIAYAPSDPRKVYAGTGELSYRYPSGMGFFRSTDGGETFDRLVASSGEDGAAGHYARIHIDPADATQGWVASDTGLWRLDGSGFEREVLPAPAAGQPVTDVAVIRNPNNANEDILLVGVSSVGVARTIYDRRRKRTAAWTVFPTATFTAPPAGIRTVRVAWSSPPGVPVAYALMEQNQPGPPPGPNDGFPSRLFTGTNLGTTWAAPAGSAPMEHEQGIGWYALSLAVNPTNPQHVLAGCVNISATIDGGQHWTRLLDWTRYDNAGDRGQHADQGNIVFDRRPERRNAVWVANDGGVSFCPDTAAPLAPATAGWRKRSYGIVAAQLFDLTTHPRYPGLCGGGMQDNGTFVSYGGPTWYRLLGGDGGALGMHPTSPYRFYPSTQSSVERVDVSQFPPVPAPLVAPPMPRNSASLPEVAAPANVHAPLGFDMRSVAVDPRGSFFIRALQCHPATPDVVLLGAFNAVQLATDGYTFVTAAVPGLTGNTTAVAFGPAGPPAVAPHGADMWAGSSIGELFVSLATPGGAGPWTARGNFPGPITAITVHPTNPDIVAISLAVSGASARGEVLLTHNRGTNWTQVTGAAPNDLPPGSYLAVAFDPTNPRTLFVGTSSGVYVARDLPAVPVGAVGVFTPTWRTFNRGLPLVPVTDLEVGPVTRTLRCATFGRGAFECTLTGVTPAEFVLPAARLLVRNHPADDGRTYADPPNALHGDPRIGTGGQPPAPPALPAAPPPIPAATPDAGGPIDIAHSPDIRVDSPRFTRSEAFAFGEAIDGAEFDEVLVRDEPLVGDTNSVYVQVQNRGTDPATGVEVYLYFADAGTPPNAPPIPADLGFPNEAPATSAWQLAGKVEQGEIRPGEPAVVTFSWVPPLSIRENVALLAVARNGSDFLAALPAGPVAAFVLAERRAALHVTHVQRDTIFIRDGLDDAGERGAVAWGGRSPDIIVRQAQVAAANFATEFQNRAASHAEDRVRGAANFIYVRVTNRTRVVVPRSNVRLFRIARSVFDRNPGAPAGPAPAWTEVTAAAGVPVNNIPAGGFGIAEIPFTPPADPDPDASAAGKGVIFLAMANVTDAAGLELDPFPDLPDATDITTFWGFFTGAPLANNAAMRALRFSP